MPKFLNTSAVTYHLEELIKNSQERLILISPYLKFNDRMRELLEDRDRLKIDIRIVYGKNELQPEENNWLKGLAFVRTSFCKNLHAKCYVSESRAIITSMNLYEFSQVNNNEMGVLIDRAADDELYMECLKESQRLIRISEELKVTVERVEREEEEDVQLEAEDSSSGAKEQKSSEAPNGKVKKISTSQLSKSIGKSNRELFSLFLKHGWIVRENDNWLLTPKGEHVGGEVRKSARFGDYIVWPEGLELPE